MTLEELRGKRIGVLGLGVNNRLVAEWLVRHGVAHVAVLDENAAVNHRGLTGVEWHLGPAAFTELDQYDLLLRNPTIPIERDELQRARQAGAQLSSQTALFFALCPAQTIGVTGTKGKGTTASLIHSMLTVAGKRSFLAGNIGRDPFEFLDQLTADDWVVLELSSFQLEGMTQSPHVAVVLSVLSDHLDRHGTLAAYQQAKRPIVAYQSVDDYAVLHRDDPVSANLAAATSANVQYYSAAYNPGNDGIVDGAVVVNGELQLLQHGNSTGVMPVSELTLRGPHNVENVAAAAAAAQLAGVPATAIAQATRSFPGLPHRLEPLGTVGGVTFVNDSYATAPLPTIAALRSFTEPIVLILGGQGKGLAYDELAAALREATVRAIVCYGAEGRVLERLATEALGSRTLIEYVQPFDDAVRTARHRAQRGDVVLLSPAATSYDQFRNATERGERFTQLVEEFAHES